MNVIPQSNFSYVDPHAIQILWIFGGRCVCSKLLPL
jgi:hypothetical protein